MTISLLGRDNELTLPSAHKYTPTRESKNEPRTRREEKVKKKKQQRKKKQCEHHERSRLGRQQGKGYSGHWGFLKI